MGARRVVRIRRRVRRTLAWRLVRGTVATCLRYRVTGLAAEGAFFAILSLPPLVFGLAGSVGYVVGGFGPHAINEVKGQLVDIARGALTEDSVQRVIVPTLNAVLDRGRADVISIGFVLALWSGSRALNVLIDTITIMYGFGGRRGIVRTRVLSFSMYVVALAIGIVVIPLVLAGPTLVDSFLPSRLQFLVSLYWPVVVVASTGFLATLYHLALPERTPWRHDFGGAAVAMVMWLAGGWVLRTTLTQTIGGTSIYGPLAAPIVVLLWLYVVVISLLVGAAFNATLHAHLERRAEARRRVADGAEAPREASPRRTEVFPGVTAGEHPLEARNPDDLTDDLTDRAGDRADDRAGDRAGDVSPQPKAK
ncbi:membrane protein [Actinopolymorpha cephalotaxi]|uniref:Membrane protein n=1 Tax=Actinopolymorpha cephalotaxi TaxID=504797 RepID=A0A1I2PQF1_9ACTN|nr:membrane protein [Actinopolymorpha cephalotaxi]